MRYLPGLLLASWVNTTETVLGIGAGAGLEYDCRVFNEDLSPLVWNIEPGVGLVDFDEVDYNFSTFLFGAGARYRFKNRTPFTTSFYKREAAAIDTRSLSLPFFKGFR